MTHILPATESDFPAIHAIYAPYVLSSTVTMETIPPNLATLKTRWQDNLVYLVAKEGNETIGYAYAFPYRPRPGYRHTVEESVYVSAAHQGKGIGKKLLQELITQCSQKDFAQMLAIIAGSGNAASLHLHTSLGFTQSGILTHVGNKFGQWIDTVLMQKAL